jgi:hypothetical protein
LLDFVRAISCARSQFTEQVTAQRLRAAISILSARELGCGKLSQAFVDGFHVP